MMRFTWFVASSLVLTIAAGCLGGGDDDEGDEDAALLGPPIDAFGRSVSRLPTGNGTAVVALAAGALSEVRAEGAPMQVALPGNVWVLEAGRLTPPAPVHEVADGGALVFLVPPAAQNITLIVMPVGSLPQDVGDLLSRDGLGQMPTDPRDIGVYTLPTPWSWEASFVSGGHVVDLMEIQEAEYPHRTPGMPNYERAQDYFVEYLRGLGYTEVFKDPVVNTLPQPDGLPLGIKPQSVANVYAYRPGTGTPDRIVAFGGHYDMVEQTVHSAFDDTTGTLMTLAMARAFAEIETDVGLLFGLWGGEEDGLLGSEYFVRTHPDLAAQTVLYINFDVSAMSWPGPAVVADPIIVSPGPDGPIAEDLTEQARHILSTYLPEMPEDKVIYEAIGQGQATGQGGVNAQSDHTSFMAAGVPVYFPFTGNVSNAFRFLHGPQDTLHNMTWFMGTQGILDAAEPEPEMTPAEEALGRQLLARSMETFMAFAVYQTLEIDAGLWSPPARGPVPGPLHA